MHVRGWIKMLEFKIKVDRKTGEKWIETQLKGKSILTTPLLNKGTAFTREERIQLELLGKLPQCVETLDNQVQRAYQQFQCYASDLQKHIYLNNLHDKSEIIFYKLVGTYLEEMFPYVYTPGVGSAVKAFSREFRQPRGLYVSYPDKDHIGRILDNRTHPDISAVVITDGEGVLGIGDQGIGAMDIPIAKLVVYTLCGLNPYQALPVMLDVGTDNEALLADPLYLGWRHKRIHGPEYDAFIDTFLKELLKRFPKALVHWEDFGKNNARRLLEKYRTKFCTFNDDIQGTGIVTLGALLAAIKATNIPVKDQRIVVFGAGTAGMGITDQLCAALVRLGLTQAEAQKCFWLVDRFGMLSKDSVDLNEFQAPYARDPQECATWSTPQDKSLLSVVREVKPTILIGASTIRNAFSEEIVRTMAQHVAKPIIFPLSNPTEQCEGHPQHLLEWTEGRGLIATGSPFPPVPYHNKMIRIAQCNNALAFPGLGIGALVVQSKIINDNMLWAAAKVIAEQSPLNKDQDAPVLPALFEAKDLAFHVALAVARQAIADGLATYTDDKQPLENRIQEMLWQPEYYTVKSV
jgi:malate dehydrogenase (oxaloacetate-decarboxylating)